MTKVDFYVQPGQDAAQRLILACKLTEKAYRLGLKVHIRTASEDEARVMDDLLWTFRQGSFIPHAQTHGTPDTHDESIETPVHIGPAPVGSIDLLVNLASDAPSDATRHPRLAELVNDDAVIRQSGRDKFRHYKSLGLEIETHKLGE